MFKPDDNRSYRLQFREACCPVNWKIPGVPNDIDDGDDVSVTCVIPVRNEGPDLEYTIAGIMCADRVPDEVIIVDDCSIVPIDGRISTAFMDRIPFRVLRNDQGLGSGRAKSRGVCEARGDLVIVMDSHLRPPPHWLVEFVRAYRLWPYSVFCAVCETWSVPGKRMRGAEFVPGEDGAWRESWREGVKSTYIGERIPCLMGGCYAFGRKLMAHMGGYNPVHMDWGYEQASVSFRAAALGFDTRIVGTVAIPHRFRGHGEAGLPNRKTATGYHEPGWHYLVNKHVTLRTVFPERYAAFHKDFLDMAAKRNRDHVRDKLASMEEDIETLSRHVAENRVRSEEEVLTFCNLPNLKTSDDWNLYARSTCKPAGARKTDVAPLPLLHVGDGVPECVTTGSGNS